jgi:hypothetical protein
LAAVDDGSQLFLAVGGQFVRAGGKKVWRVARWDGQRWLGFSGPRKTGFDDDVFSLEVFDAGSGPELYAGGWFVRAGGTRAFAVARWDGRRWHPVGNAEKPGFLGTARDLVAVRTGPLEGLYAVGGIIDIEQHQAAGIVLWDGLDWVPLTGQPTQWDDGWVAAPYEDEVGQSLYITGSGMEDESGLKYRLARWNGQQWAAVPGTTSPDEILGWIRTLLVFDDGSGPALYAGGEFELLGENGPENIARLTCVSKKSAEDQE